MRLACCKISYDLLKISTKAIIPKYQLWHNTFIRILNYLREKFVRDFIEKK